MKKCYECSTRFEVPLGSTNRKYCDKCRYIIKNKKEAKALANKKNKMEGSDKSYIISTIFNSYKKRAFAKNIEFSVDIQVFNDNFRGLCFYCNERMKNVGFDRLINSKGYTPENIVPCCTRCNIMKHTKNYGEFIEACKKIAYFH